MTPVILEETSRGTQQYTIESDMMRRRELFLTEQLDATTSMNLIKQLMYLEQLSPGEPITLYINSPGGEVYSGMAVYDYIMLMQSPVHTVCIGTAASMGSLLFLAGTERKMLKHTQIMIHDPSFAAGNIGGMKPHEIQQKLDSLCEVSQMLSEAIIERTGMSEEQVSEITKQDTYFTAEEALKSGIATEILREL